MNIGTLNIRSRKEYWIKGFKETRVGKIPIISTKLNGKDNIDNIKARLGNFRNNYRIHPGLYCAGDPNEKSPVLVTSNYKLTFDTLRRELDNINCWIMVLDTYGINVWCAAGKGTFGTSELIKRVNDVRLNEIIDHRNIILPQLGAPGVSAHQVKKESGFKVVYGPVRARDINAFLRNDLRKDLQMRTVTFNLRERLAIIPLELVFALPTLLLVYIIVFVLDWVSDGGINIGRVFLDYIPFLSAVIAGGIAVPLFLPFIPARSFSIKGLMAGIVAAVSVNAYFHPPLVNGIFNFLLITTTATLFGLTYTGSTPYTSVSGVTREVKLAFRILMPLLVVSIFGELALKLSQSENFGPLLHNIFK